MAYTITAVSESVRQWNSTKGGPMNSYRVNLRDSQGQDSLNVELSQKSATPAPTVGQELEGNVDNSGEYGLKFKKAFAQGGGGGGRSMSPEDRASIVRQHSQEMALRAIDLGATWGIIDKPADSRAFLALIEWMTDHFVKDARKVIA